MLDKHIRKIIPIFFTLGIGTKVKRPILTLKRRRTDPGYVPPTPFDLFLNKALGTGTENPLSEYSGFWTIDRLMRTSISIGCRYETTLSGSSRFVVCHHSDATHHVHSRSGVRKGRGIISNNAHVGLSTLIFNLMSTNDVTAMQQCVLKCDDTNRYISLASAALILPVDLRQKFCDVKDVYTLFNKLE